MWHQKNILNRKRIDKLYFIEMQNFFASKYTTKKMERQATEWEENICKLHIW